MKANILKEKKNLLMVGAILIVVIAIILICFVFEKDKDKDNEIATETLENKLEQLGMDFYENHYYADLTEEDKKDLPNFKDNGIKIDITNLEVIVPIGKDVKDQLKKDKCNFDETKIIIYPKESYGQKDYTIKTELSCKK